MLVEVGDSSLLRDVGTKAALYARHGVPEYWIVNVPSRTLEVRRGPRAGSDGWFEAPVYREGEAVTVNGKPVAVSDLLPKAESL